MIIMYIFVQKESDRKESYVPMDKLLKNKHWPAKNENKGSKPEVETETTSSTKYPITKSKISNLRGKEKCLVMQFVSRQFG